MKSVKPLLPKKIRKLIDTNLQNSVTNLEQYLVLTSNSCLKNPLNNLQFQQSIKQIQAEMTYIRKHLI